MADAAFLEERLREAVRLAREAGRILLSRFGGRLDVRHKGVIDLVTDADRASEDFIVAQLVARFPDHSVMTEESGGHRGSSPYTWVVDPLDGTVNYAHGFPFFSVSIALADHDQPVAGAVHDPVRDETFSAVRGGGAFLNGRPIKVSTVAALTDALLVTGFPYDIRSGEETNLDHFAAFAVTGQAIRRVGSAALDLCYVGAGRFDGYWELKLKPWDMAAGVLIAREAGGMVTDFNAADYNIRTTRIVASNGLLHPAMLEIIRSRRERPNG